MDLELLFLDDNDELLLKEIEDPKGFKKKVDFLVVEEAVGPLAKFPLTGPVIVTVFLYFFVSKGLIEFEEEEEEGVED